MKNFHSQMSFRRKGLLIHRPMASVLSGSVAGGDRNGAPDKVFAQRTAHSA